MTQPQLKLVVPDTQQLPTTVAKPAHVAPEVEVIPADATLGRLHQANQLDLAPSRTHNGITFGSPVEHPSVIGMVTKTFRENPISSTTTFSLGLAWARSLEMVHQYPQVVFGLLAAGTLVALYASRWVDLQPPRESAVA